MKGAVRSVCCIAAAFSLLTGKPIGVAPTVGAQSAEPLLTQADFTYVGAFKLPSGTLGSLKDTFDYTNGYVAGNVYADPARGKSLFIKGELSALQVSTTASVAQVVIPSSIKDPNSVGVAGLTTATLAQGFSDPSNGIASQIKGAAGNGYGSLVVYGGKLIGTETAAYDANCAQSSSAWVSSLDFSKSSQATGGYKFSESISPRYIGGGFMTVVPSEWRTALGGPVVSGNGPASIVSCGPAGPSLHVIDGDTLVGQPAATTVISASPLVYYEDGIHSTLGLWNSNRPNQVVNGQTVPSITVTDPHSRGSYSFAYEDNAMRIEGVLFADGTRSVLFFGRKGMGPYCYGVGSDCGDQDSPTGKGDHSYPYTEFVWAYDVNDLIAVKQGVKQPWNVFPYAGWAFKVFGDSDGGQGVGVSWDASTRTAYMTVAFTNDAAPLVHAFKVGQGGAVLGAPSAPANVRIIR